jgi:hypothetical protein
MYPAFVRGRMCALNVLPAVRVQGRVCAVRVRAGQCWNIPPSPCCSMQPWNAADISEDEERPVTTVSDLTDSRLSALPGTVVAAARLEHTTHTASIIVRAHGLLHAHVFAAIVLLLLSDRQLYARPLGPQCMLVAGTLRHPVNPVPTCAHSPPRLASMAVIRRLMIIINYRTALHFLMAR